MAHIKWPGMQVEMLNARTATIADDMLAFIDQVDRKLIRVYDPQNGKQLQEIRMKTDVIEASLAQTDIFGPAERLMAIIDRSYDLHLVVVKRAGKVEPSKKLGMMIHSMVWHSEAALLAVIRDSKLRIFYFPQILYVEESILDSTWEDKDLG